VLYSSAAVKVSSLIIENSLNITSSITFWSIVSVCPGGQVLLTCERMSGFFLYWDVSVPRLHAMNREVIVPNQGGISTTALQSIGLHLTEFNITHTSGNPLISQMLITNATTEINGSTIHCSEDGNENGAPAVAVNVMDNGIIMNE
jgi:hypothetical protein